MTLGYSDIAERASATPVWFGTLVLEDGTGSGTKTIYISDTDRIIGSTQYVGVATWDTIYWGQQRLASFQYTQAEVSLRLSVRHVTDQDHDHTILDALNGWHIVGAVLTMKRSYIDLDDPDAAAQTRFVGRVYAVDAVTPSAITISARADLYSDIQPIDRLRVDSNRDARGIDDDKPIPIIAGQIGFLPQHWLYDKALSALTTNNDWDLFCFAHGGSECVMTDTDPDAPVVTVSSGAISDTTPPDDARLLAVLSSNPRSPLLLTGVGTSNYNESAATITIPILGGSEYSGAADAGEIAVRRFDIPVARDSAVEHTNWTNWTRAFDGNVNTYAEIVGSGNVLQSEGQNFINSPPPANAPRATAPDASDGALDYVLALIWTDGSPDVRLGITWAAEVSSQTQDFTTLVDGWNIIKMEMSDSAISNTIRTTGWAVEPADGIYIQMISPTSSQSLRVYMFGVSWESLPPGDILSTEDSDTTDDRAEPPRLIYKGYGPEEGTSATSEASNGIRQLMVAATRNADVPLTLSDFDGTTGGFGAWGVLESEMDANFADIETSAFITERWRLAFQDRRDDELGAWISRVQLAIGASIWYSPREDLYRARLRQVDADANGKILYRSDIRGDDLTCAFTPMDDIRTATYVDFNPDENGRLLSSVWVDNSTVGSRGYDGAADTTREGQADDRQRLYGRREHRVRTPYLNDAVSAWELCLRMFDLLSVERVEMSFVTGERFAQDIEPCYVFTTDATLDDIMRYPGFVSPSSESEPSWANRKWWVTRVEETPYEGTVIRAVNID